MKHRKNKRLTVGFLSNDIADSWVTPIWSSVVDAARAADMNLISFASSISWRTPRVVRANQALYKQIKTIADGLVSTDFFVPGVRTALAVFPPRPAVSINFLVDGIPSVVVDDKGGMYAAVSHLIEAHGLRQIGFIRGPENQHDSDARYQAYQEALAAHGLPLNPDLVTICLNHHPVNGEAGIRLLLDERKVQIEALVASNDDMALGAIYALRARGLRVPEDVAVVGFDDRIEGRSSIPPLTTSRTPIMDMGRRAFESVAAQLRGEAAPAQELLPVELILRRSCGCLPQIIFEANKLPQTIAPEKRDWETQALAVQLKEMLAAQEDSLSSIGVADWAEQLWDAFKTDLEAEHGIRLAHARAFLSTLNNLVSQVVAPLGNLAAWQATIENADLYPGSRIEYFIESDVAVWQIVLFRMRQQARQLMETDQARWLLADELFQQGLVYINETILHHQMRAQLAEQTHETIIRQVGQKLITAFDFASLVRILAHELPRLGIPGCYLVLHEGQNWPPPSSRLVFAFRSKETLKLEPGGEVFPTNNLLPRKIWPASQERLNWLVWPLAYQNEPLGYVLFEVGPQDMMLYRTLAGLLSSALKGALLVEQVEAAYRTLQENQEKLLITEKMASLGRLTAGIAHEMNTPLATTRAALTELNKLIDEYETSLGDAEVTPDDHREIAHEMRNSAQLADRAATRATGIVGGIKAQTRDMGPHERQRFEAVQVIQEALLLLEHAAQYANCQLIFEPPANGVELFGTPGRLAQVVTNLVTNAINANVVQGGSLITLKLIRQPQGVDLQVEDQGCGIPPENMSKIFDPMFTTKRFGEGTGLGLSIVHDIVISDFGGTIDVSSRVSQGSTFIIHFPAQN